MKKFFVLKPFIIVLLTIASTILLLVVFCNGLEDSYLAYFVYPFSAYSLSILVVNLTLQYKNMKNKVIKLLTKNNTVKEILNDKTKRYFFYLVSSFTFNFVLALLKIGIGIYISSYWVLINGIFYLILALLRCFLAISWNIDTEKQKARMKIVIFFFFILSLSYLGIFIEMYINYSSFTYPYYLIYLSALYAFTNISLSIKDFFSKKTKITPIIFSYRCVKVATATISIIFLESSMLKEFGTNSSNERLLLLIAGIVGVLIIQVLSIAMLMHIKGRRDISNTLIAC